MEGPGGPDADAAVKELCDAFCGALGRLLAEIDEYIKT
jgi:hypothetical protein